MNRVAAVIASVIVSSGCCTLRPGSDACEGARYGVGWTHNTDRGGTVPRCTDVLLDLANEAAPAPLRPLHGLVIWYPAPFDCSPPFGQMVWGCSDIGRPFVAVSVVGKPGDHASDTALAEEVAHFVWQKTRPTVITEEWRVDPFTGKKTYWRDPEFQAWFNRVREEAKRSCP